MSESASFDSARIPSSRLFSGAAFVAMLCGVVAVYFPPSLWDGDTTLHGMDFWALHLRRIEFVHELGSSGSFSGWYPRELLGTPFWSNLQNFPWIPTRLMILAIDPVFSFTVGVNLSALLAAAFTYLYGRIIGWNPAASALAGWTFACAGFYAARVTVGHLPLLEAYPALPMLLWLAERSMRSGQRSSALLALAVGTAFTVLAGHPQLPAYAVATTCAYLLWMAAARGEWSDSFRPVGAIVLGAAATLVVWWPMLSLLGRSTRTLPLAAAQNDLVFPYERLLSLLAPWVDGWPSAVHRSPAEPFVGFPGTAYFWDTYAYVGVVPWLAVVIGLLAWGLNGWLNGWLSRGLNRTKAPTGSRSRHSTDHRLRFIAVLGVASLFLALPVVETLGEWIPGTYLRSPARLLYLTTFALCIALGAGCQALLQSGWTRSAPLRIAATIVLAAIHIGDLFLHDQPFLYARPRTLRSMPTAMPIFEEHLGAERMAVDYNLSLDFNRRFDDVGFFDSIILARPYRALLAMAQMPSDTNVQDIRGSALPATALANLGVRFIVTSRNRTDLPLFGRERYSVYVIPNPVARVAFFDTAQVSYLAEPSMLDRLASDGFDLGSAMMLEPPRTRDGEGAAPLGVGDVEALAEYSRPAPDRIAIQAVAPRAGFVRVLESWDPGWTATVDGQAVPVLRSDSFVMAVAVAAGPHEIEWRYATPGFAAGAAGSLLSVVSLIGLLCWNVRRPIQR